MGYDMHWKTKAAGEEEAVAAARDLFYAACNVRDALPDGSRGTYSDEEWKRLKAGEMGHDDYPANVTDEYRAAQDEVRRLGDELDKVNRSYFRLNIWGMSKLSRDIKLTFGSEHVLRGAVYSEDDFRSHQQRRVAEAALVAL
jgi:hypothetical protein